MDRDENHAGLLSGTLDLLILKVLSLSELHGYAIAQNIHRMSREALRVEEGSLYPALQRMEVRGWVKAVSKKTPTGRQARYYSLTTVGRKQLEAETESFQRSVLATTRVLRSVEP